MEIEWFLLKLWWERSQVRDPVEGAMFEFLEDIDMIFVQKSF